MKLAISNIAWDQSEDLGVAELLNELGISVLEAAPAKINAEILEITQKDCRAYREFWEQKGIAIEAMQAILFGKPELQIFCSPESRQLTFGYCQQVIQIASWLGVKVIVFGSPKNRWRPEGLTLSQAEDIAIPFFRELGDFSEKHKIDFCLEPNAPQYNCNFLTNTKETVEFLRKVNHPNLRLNLDSGVIKMNGEDPSNVVDLAAPYLTHYHISEPQLQLVGTQGVDHQTLAEKLRQIGYNGLVSIEMRPNLLNSNFDAIREAVNIAQKFYA